MSQTLRTIPALTGLRFVAALLVFLAHVYPVIQFHQTTNAFVYLFHGLGGTGMVLFVALSGCVMWLNYADDFRSGCIREAFWRFAVARFARLYPLYIVVLLSIMLLDWQPVDTAALGYFLPMLQAWLPAREGNLLLYGIPRFEHSWSLSVELTFYLLFPAAVLLSRLIRGKRQLSVLMASLIAAGVLTTLTLGARCDSFDWSIFRLTPSEGCSWIIYYSPITHLFEFLAGMGVAAALGSLQPTRPRPLERKGAACILVAILVVMGLSSYLRAVSAIADDIWLQAVSQAILLPAVAALIFVVSRFEGLTSRVLSSRSMVAGGEWSYSLYLLHPLVITFFVQPPAADLSLAALSRWVGSIALILGLCLLLSWISYSLIEVPARRFIRRVGGASARASGADVAQAAPVQPENSLRALS